MTFIEVEELPKNLRAKAKTRKPQSIKKDLQEFMTRFMEADIRFAKVTYNDAEYVNLCSAQTALVKCVRTFNLPIRVQRINYEVYLIRIDL